MRVINILQAKKLLSRLADKVAAGVEIIITKAGKPIIKRVPIEKTKERKFGMLKEKIHIGKNFDAPLEEDIINAFEGRDKNTK